MCPYALCILNLGTAIAPLPPSKKGTSRVGQHNRPIDIINTLEEEDTAPAQTSLPDERKTPQTKVSTKTKMYG
uniref:Uncharacterized protein n=1 Tax=Anguilla anguilla TaxID=7936 RepID=A0A0E9TFM1_ANGAN